MSDRYKRWKALWHPERYHGWGSTKNYFEGWYYKIVKQHAFAFIPGISMNSKGEQHTFIQEIVGKVNESLQSSVHVKLFDRKNLIFEGDGQHTGLEVAGPVEELLTDIWRR
ncbi:MAG: hypothetical protein MI974_08200 [Chitinophagales bacterium]|nr:hypothetical protein [Chitinophagales bacterium]